MKETTGLVLVFTGDGKGKTTAALGQCMRAIGWKQKVCFIQFLKSPEFECGEKLFCHEKNIELYSTGIGYSWKKSIEEQRNSIQKAWEFTISKLKDTSYHLIVLDEINPVLAEKRFDLSDILTEDILIKALKQRDIKMNVVLTGRMAGSKLIEYADLVTEMKLIKHPYQKGVKAKRGIEY